MDGIRKRGFGSISERTRNRFLQESHWLLLALAALGASYVIYAGTLGHGQLTMAAASLAIVAVFAVRTAIYHGVEVTPTAKRT
jgi:hypothetical protein